MKGYRPKLCLTRFAHFRSLINLFTLAMYTGMKAETIEEMIFAFPTLGSDMVYMV